MGCSYDSCDFAGLKSDDTVLVRDAEQFLDSR